MSRIYQYPVVTEIGSDDYLALGSTTNGSRSILASDLAPVIGSKTITERGTYKASDDNMDGYGQVTVDIPYTDIHVASGDIATFEGEDLPLKSLKVAVTPYQDLHGYDAPWAGGAGKNKLDIANASLAKPSWYSGGWNNASLNSDYGLTIKRTYNEGGAGGFTIDNLVGGKTYTISFAVSDANLQYRVGIYYSTNGTDTTTLANSLSMQSGTGIKYYSFDLPSEAKYVCFRPTLNDGTSPYDIYKIQIEEGSSATSFAPYSNICPIIGWDEAVVTRCGKNLCNIADGNITTTKQIGVATLKAGTYTLSLEAYRQDGGRATFSVKNGETTIAQTEEVTGATTYKPLSVTFTLTEETTVILYCSFFISYSTLYYKNIMIELGTIATTYSPYNGATYTIDLDGTRYGGVLDATNGGGTMDRDSVNLNSIDAFSSDAVNENGYIRYNCGIVGKAHNFNILCDKIKVIQSTVQANANEELISGNANNNKLYFTIDSTKLSGDLSTSTGRSNALKTYLATNDIQVVYELATPITVQLAPTPVKSIEGENNIFANCGAVDVEYQTVWVRPTN